ncbi:MAG: hypothetical protein ACWGQW_01875 [bacterium]
MQTIELSIGRCYIYRGQVFKTNEIYEVDDALARELLEKTTDRGLPHFRITMLPEGDTPATPEKVDQDKQAMPNLKPGSVKRVGVRKKKVVAKEDEDEIQVEKSSGRVVKTVGKRRVSRTADV